MGKNLVVGSEGASDHHVGYLSDRDTLGLQTNFSQCCIKITEEGR